jgi:cyclophilin family peptidyl-prolyl cis-trans isomerase
MLIRLLTAALVAAPPAATQEAPKKEGPQLKLSIAADAAEVAVGGELQLEARLRNDGPAPLTVPALALEERALSFTVTIDGSDGKPRTFSYARIEDHPLVARRLDVERVSLPAGKELVGYFKIPALAVGKMVVRGRLAMGEPALESEKDLTVAVTPVDGKSKLAARVQTDAGDFTIRLAAEQAPANVAHWLSLVQRRFYDGMVFHSIVTDKWLAAGCPFGKGTGGPGYAVRGEIPPKDPPPQERGTVSLCSYGSGEARPCTGSQFFICLTRLPAFDGQFTVIGAVSEEADREVLDKIGKEGGSTVAGSTGAPLKEIRIKSITVQIVN